MKIPKGMSLSSVPDLSRFGPQQQKPLLAITVKPGDHVMVLLPQTASQHEVATVSQMLKQWAPNVQFMVLSGPESITVIPGDPVEDKQPQGQMTDAELVAYAKRKAAEVVDEHDTEVACTCYGTPHHRYSHGCVSA